MCNNIDTLQSLKTMDFYNYSCHCCYYFGHISKASKHSFIFFHKKFRSKYFRVPMVNQGVQDPHALFLKALWFKTGPSCPVASWMSSNGPLCSNMLFPLMDKKNQKSWAKIKLPSIVLFPLGISLQKWGKWLAHLLWKKRVLKLYRVIQPETQPGIGVEFKLRLYPKLTILSAVSEYLFNSILSRTLNKALGI